MSEALKERKEMDSQYQWDLTKMYANALLLRIRAKFAMGRNTVC